MPLRSTVIFWLVLVANQWAAVSSLESVDELVCLDIEAGSRIPHPEFCNVYIMCTDNGAMLFNCEQNVLYNPIRELCDASYRICLSGSMRDDNGDVIQYEGEEEEEESEEEEEETQEKDQEDEEKLNTTKVATTTTLLSTSSIKLTTTTSITVSHTSRPSPSIASLPTSNAISCPRIDSDKLLLLSDATKCSIYYICYHGKPVPMECSMGLYWSENNYKCVPKELSECHARSAADHYPKCPSVGIEFLPHEEHCERFWYCRDGFRMLQQCDAFFHWDINERKCKRIPSAVCYRDALKSLS